MRCVCGVGYEDEYTEITVALCLSGWGFGTQNCQVRRNSGGIYIGGRNVEI